MNYEFLSNLSQCMRKVSQSSESLSALVRPGSPTKYPPYFYRNKKLKGLESFETLRF